MTADAVGGVWTYALELCRTLGTYDVSVLLATMGPLPGAEQIREARGLENVELVSKPFRLEWMDDPWCGVDAAAEWLLELEERVRPDLVHLNGYAHGNLPWTAPTLMVGHSCVLSWWRAVKGEEAPANWAEYHRRVKAGLNAAGLVVAPSAAMMAELQRCYGPLPNTAIILNGREIEFRTPEKEALIFSAGRVWDEAKNISAVMNIAAELPWRVAVAGECSGKTPPNGVELLGRLSANEMAAWLARASIYVLPAKYEPFGLSVLEAALSRCALVLGDIPSLREIWGEDAVYVNPNSPSQLRRVLLDLSAAPDALEELADRAHTRALEFTPDRMAAAYLGAYSRLLSREEHMPEVPEPVVCES